MGNLKNMNNFFIKVLTKAIIIFVFFLVPTFILAEDNPIILDGPTLLPKAQLYIVPSNQDIIVGSNFEVPIYINTQGKSINTIKVDLNFNPSDVSIVGSSGVDSILGILFESPTYDNQSGIASVTGIIPDGIITNSGLITTLTFKALSIGETTIYINDYSSANLNDGIGSEVILTLDEATYNIVEGEIENICITNPSDPSCTVSTYCELHPTDPVCSGLLDFCNQNPTDPSCNPTRPTWCDIHPDDLLCTSSGTFCSLYPDDPSCNITNQNNGDNENNSNSTNDVITDIVSNTITNVSEVKSLATDILNTKEGEVTSKIITTTGAATGAFISIATGMFASPITFSELFLIPFRIWSLILTALGLKKKNVPWGTVYDSVTKQPLDPAYVILKDLDGNEVSTSITDLDGRYGFLVAPGNYKMSANKTNYEFPSKRLAGKTSDELYNDLYFDQIIQIEEGGVITKNIPMDPIKFDWNEFAKRDKKLMKFFKKRDLWISKISEILFFFGFIVAMIATFVAPAFYNIVILVIYVFLYISRKTILKPRAFGYIRQKFDKNPLSFAIIRAFFPGSDHEVVHKVADKTGKYYCLIPNGRYDIKIDNKNLDGTYSSININEPVEVKNGYINKKFEI